MRNLERIGERGRGMLGMWYSSGLGTSVLMPCGCMKPDERSAGRNLLERWPAPHGREKQQSCLGSEQTEHTSSLSLVSTQAHTIAPQSPV